jgi:hypothetical protein
MNSNDSVVLSAFTEHKRVLKLWVAVGLAGLLIFLVLLGASYVALNAPTIVSNPYRYKRTEALLGFSELAGLALSALALLRYTNLKYSQRVPMFQQFLSDNKWSLDRKFKLGKVPAVALGDTSNYEENYAFSGEYMGRTFHCLIFEFDTPLSSSTHHLLCLSFKLRKGYPMIVIDNKLNDHGYRRHESNLPSRIPDGVNISLEGNFDKYYRTSTTKSTEQKAVYVLSPDFMIDLVGQVQNKVDIEIEADDLFLIYEADFYTGQNVEALFTVAKVVLSKFDKLSKSWLAASGSNEKTAMAQMAHEARRKLIYRSDYVGMATTLLLMVLLIVLMVSGG